MNVALSSPSPGIESSYLSYTNSNGSPRPFPQPPIEHPSREASRNSSPQPASVTPFERTLSVPRSVAEDHGRREHSTTPSSYMMPNSRPNVSQDREGQNHDRMDTDPEDEDSFLSEQASHISRDGHPGTFEGGTEDGGEPMDTTPDSSTTGGSQTVQLQEVAVEVPLDSNDPIQTSSSTDQDLSNSHSSTQVIEQVSDPLPDSRNTPSDVQNGGPVTPLRIATDSDLLAAETMVAIHRSQPTNPNETVPEQPETSRTAADDENDDDSDDGSSEDEEPSTWSNIQEDTSVPSEEERKEIEDGPAEISALDHEHWEKTFFTPLADPEYEVGECGRISWTVQGFHGTRTSPNKEKIMRSPVVKIGGYNWNIKLFPRGNEDEGTDFISVYVECSKDEEESATNTTSEDLSERDEIPWSVATQIGCVMYNPEEPRVRVTEKSAHQFCNENSDWGWVRFHGPWNTIHRRHPFQRQALLRNDTIAITAYIRTVSDYTGGLWWHPSEEQPTWNGLTKTGYRGLFAQHAGGSALVAAMAAWLHLAPFNDLILNTHVHDSVRQPEARNRPLIFELQGLLYNLRGPLCAVTGPVPTEGIVKAVKWHGWEEINPPDAMVIWETLRYLLNIECWNDKNVDSYRDVLGDFLTLRQQMPRDVFTRDSTATRSLLHSTQEVLDHAFQEGDNSLREWEEFDTIPRSKGHPPSILQIELHRQSYSISSRKWKRLTHQIEMNETIVYKDVSAGDGMSHEYTLYGMIVHSGDLESEDYYAVIRPDGPNSRWLKYGDVRDGYVRYLTRTQAIDAHQGEGETSEGTDAVAYVVIYVRTDCISSILHQHTEPWKPTDGIRDPIVEEVKHLPISQHGETYPVLIYNSTTFDKSSDRGIFDTWNSVQDADDVLRLDLPGSTSIKDIQNLLVTQFNLAGMPQQCRLWWLDEISSTSRWSPRFEELVYTSQIHDHARIMGSCKFWLHIIPIDLIPATIPEAPASDEPNEPVPSRIASSEHLFEPPDADVAALLATIQTPAPLVEPLGFMGSGVEDVVMGGTQGENWNTVPPPPVPPTVPSIAVREKSNDIYFFVKIFDFHAQKFKKLGAHLASKKEKVGEVLERLQITVSEKSYLLFSEEGGDIMQPNLKARHTFEAENLSHGAVIVLSERLPPHEIKSIEVRGDCADIIEYYTYLSSTLNPVWNGNHYIKSYFGSSYFDMSLSRSNPHGHCVSIDMYGNAFSGNYIAGEKCGHGVMKYANGDTYDGNWEANFPEGRGTKVYGSTGNKYEGGWKKGRRHGKGTMHFEVADEELQLCKICFEAEMDALFYRCGHVVACEECARQVKDCPICRRNVDAVVKIWRTT